MKTKCTAYLLWFFMGLWGFHHFYLGRPRHGFLHFITVGGFLIGWIRDAFFIPRYVEEANLQKETFKSTRSWYRMMGEIVISLYFVVFYRLMIPENHFQSFIWYWLTKLLMPAVVALGIILVRGSGQDKNNSSDLILKISYLSSVLYMFYEKNTFYSIIITCVLSNYYDKKFIHKTTQMTTQTLIITSMAYILLGMIINMSWLFFSILEIRLQVEGEEVKLRDVITLEKFIVHTREFIYSVIDFYQRLGIFGIIGYAINKFIDPKGLRESLTYLNLPMEATVDMVRKVCRKLASQHHPDRFFDIATKKLHEKEYQAIRFHCDNLLFQD